MTMDYRQVGDQLGDAAFADLKTHPYKYQALLKCSINSDLDQFALDTTPFGEMVQKIVSSEFCAITDLKSALFFENHARSILAILGLYSLPYCFAGARGARVLMHSQRLRNQADKRLLETAQFVFDVCNHMAFRADGKGKLAIVKVRMMHAAARFYSRQVIVEETPVNQEDMLGTLISFSLLVIRGLRTLGKNITAREAEAYQQRWNFIGELLGIEVNLLPKTLRQASTEERNIRRKEFRYSDDGQQLTDALIEAFYQNRGIPGAINIRAMMHYFLGEEVSQCIGLGQQNIWEGRLGIEGLKIQQLLSQITTKGFGDLLKEFDELLSARKVEPDFSISFKES